MITDLRMFAIGRVKEEEGSRIPPMKVTVGSLHAGPMLIYYVSSSLASTWSALLTTLGGQGLFPDLTDGEARSPRKSRTPPLVSHSLILYLGCITESPREIWKNFCTGTPPQATF